jgi:uncharacterized membrane protein
MSDKKDARLLDVLVATYDNLGDAKTDLKAIQGLYKDLGTSHNFDAVVISKNEKGKVKIDKTYEAGTRHDALKGLGFGLAAGLAAVVFPPVGIGAALAAGGIGGAAIGAVVGHVQTGIPRGDLREIASQLEASTAALIAVYETSLADQVAKNIKAVNRIISPIVDLKADQIASEIRQAAA